METEASVSENTDNTAVDELSVRREPDGTWAVSRNQRAEGRGQNVPQLSRGEAMRIALEQLADMSESANLDIHVG